VFGVSSDRTLAIVRKLVEFGVPVEEADGFAIDPALIVLT
jgi:hypothetical protein